MRRNDRREACHLRRRQLYATPRHARNAAAGTPRNDGVCPMRGQSRDVNAIRAINWGAIWSSGRIADAAPIAAAAFGIPYTALVA